MEWISFKDKLPDSDSNILICTWDREIFIGQYENFGNIYYLIYGYDMHFFDECTTHWIPLPNPPTEVKLMPTYEYICQSCNLKTEITQKMSDPNIDTCPYCNNNTLNRILSTPPFHFKGKGFYSTDYP